MSYTYTYEPTADPDLFRVVDREGEWDRYFHKPTDTYLDGVTAILSRGYAKDSRFYSYLAGHSADEIKNRLETMGERGSRLHRIVAAVLRGLPLRQDSTIEGSSITNDEWDALLAFEQFWTRHQPSLIASEYPIVNFRHKYAGTLDLILRMTKTCGVRSCGCDPFVGKIGLLDLKTGGGIYPEHGSQVAAYAKGDNIFQLLGLNRIEYTGILRIGTQHKLTGGYELDLYGPKDTAKHWKEFQAAITIARRDWKPFNPDKEIVPIPDSLSLQVEWETLVTPAAPVDAVSQAEAARQAKSPASQN